VGGREFSRSPKIFINTLSAYAGRWSCLLRQRYNITSYIFICKNIPNEDEREKAYRPHAPMFRFNANAIEMAAAMEKQFTKIANIDHVLM
jgi:ribosomal protein L30E